MFNWKGSISGEQNLFYIRVDLQMVGPPGGVLSLLCHCSWLFLVSLLLDLAAAFSWATLAWGIIHQHDC